MIAAELTTKYCPKCGTDLSVDEFSKDQSTGDGLQAQCKRCRIQYRKEYHANNQDKIRQQTKEYYRANREKLSQRVKEYRGTVKGRETHRRAMKKYQATDRGREVRRQYMKEYVATLKGCLGEMFNNMKRRCDDPGHRSYKYYSGRGIRVKFESVDEFGNHVIDDLGITSMEQIKGLQIHRKDNDG
ncbi:hypothetical protein LCGC14_0536000, partial [marine sediment metagenome]